MSVNNQHWAALDSQHERLVDVSMPLPAMGKGRQRHRRIAVPPAGWWHRSGRRRAVRPRA